jgi:hypothetical protein
LLFWEKELFVAERIALAIKPTEEIQKRPNVAAALQAARSLCTH